MRGAEIYCAIHEFVVLALRKSGVDCDITGEDSENKSAACFKKLVRWDIVSNGKKLAGAGQRRGKWGTLHQGSVIGELEYLADELSQKVRHVELIYPENYELRYRDQKWLDRVP